MKRLLCLLLAVAIGVGPQGCRNPAQSDLPPSALAPPGTPIPLLPKGLVYADETEISPALPIDPGDTLEIVIRRGAGEERLTSVVRENGTVTVAFQEITVRGLTAAEAEARIQEQVSAFIRNPVITVTLKKKRVPVKRIFVFGDVNKPGQYPMTRGMTVLQAIATAENYRETAVLDQVRVIRGDLERPEILTADLSRLFTYGDFSRNYSLEENDIVFVPRTRVGDFAAQANVVLPVVFAALLPLYFAQLWVTLSPP